MQPNLPDHQQNPIETMFKDSFQTKNNSNKKSKVEMTL